MLLPPGKMWFDDRGTLEERIAKALRYYAKRGLEFNTVFVDPDIAPKKPIECDVQIRYVPMLKDYFLFCNLENGEGAVGAQPTVTSLGG